MNRKYTVLTVLGLLFAADVLAVFRTAELIPELSTTLLLSTASFEIACGGGLIWLAVEMLRKSYRRQKKPVSRWRFSLVQPLRRLFVSVWS